MEGKLIKVERGYVLMINNIIYSTDNDKLSKENCDEIFGVVDVEKLAYKTYGPETFVNHSDMYKYLCIKFFKEGFNKAMELNKDKLFTVEDIRKAYATGYGRSSAEIKGGVQPFLAEQELIQSLQQPTEIEVDVEMENYVKYVPKSLETVYPTGAVRPKLDENGCLILKKK
jgi:hypothetical protein